MKVHNGEEGRGAESVRDESSDSSQSYELSRPAGRLETYFTLFHDLNLQSNIIVSASYTSTEKRPLDASVLYPALRLVIKQHPALSIVTSSRPSTLRANHSRAWEARIKVINLKDCVSFINHFDTSKDGLASLLERQHNEWYRTEDKTKPLWRLLVVNHEHIIFVYHHLICDGIGGLAFHKALLAALNTVTMSPQSSEISPDASLVTTSTAPLAPVSSSAFISLGYSYSTLRVATTYIYLFLLRLFLPRSFFFFPSIRPPPNPSTPGPPIITKLHSFTLNPQTLSRTLTACKSHTTSLTSLLTTLILTTLSNDIYPRARFGIISIPTDLRRYIPRRLITESEIQNCASVCFTRTWLNAYKAAGQDLSGFETTTTGGPLNKSHIWALAAAHRSALERMIAPRGPGSRHTPAPIQESLSMGLLPEDKEPLVAQCLPTLWTVSGGGVTVSNLGLFGDAAVAVDDMHWKISDVEFSVGATAPEVGSALYFAMVSSVDGGLRVNISFAEGAVEEEIVERIAIGILGRLEGLLKGDE
ncbi:alcohol acetyltransferase-domain-containing protein [Leptodontidium sp. MPI-SDFR-AT-0119]|nr:alcohol acetyltransferase-domain-containing protein [Leptodontidium sp. MPI-SDFR-AT-0119]